MSRCSSDSVAVVIRPASHHMFRMLSRQLTFNQLGCLLLPLVVVVVMVVVGVSVGTLTTQRLHVRPIRVTNQLIPNTQNTM